MRQLENYMREKESVQILSFGEVLWDVYPDGKKLGGAPFNVAAHCRQLGFEAAILSRIGKDSLGDEIRKAVVEMGVDDRWLQVDDQLPTGTVRVTLDARGKPTYKIVKPVAWDAIELPDHLSPDLDALVFGTLASRSRISRDTLYSLLETDLISICDLNLRGEFYQTSLIDHLLSRTNILKLNDEEQQVVSRLFNIDKDLVFTHLLSCYEDLELIIMTRGAHGAMAIDRQGAYDHPGYHVQVVDTVGSGDSFLAGFLSKFLLGMSVDASLDFACRLGAFVATQKGAIPIYDTVPDLERNG